MFASMYTSTPPCVGVFARDGDRKLRLDQLFPIVQRVAQARVRVHAHGGVTLRRVRRSPVHPFRHRALRRRRRERARATAAVDVTRPTGVVIFALARRTGATFARARALEHVCIISRVVPSRAGVTAVDARASVSTGTERSNLSALYLARR